MQVFKKSELKDFHHYKGVGLTRFEKVERKVLELIASSNIKDENREDSKVFEFMHAAGCMQIARILAQKRNLNVDLASVCAILHDIQVIITGSYKDHAKQGEIVAEKILREIGGFSEEEIIIITNAVAYHSEKEIYTNDPYVELIKDADVFDCSLYKNAEGFYKIHKLPHIFEEYVKRIKQVRKELGLLENEPFR